MPCVTCKIVGFYRFPPGHLSYQQPSISTGLKLSTYFSAIKLRWMIENYPEVKKAHVDDDLLFGTVESWIAYVGDTATLQRLE